MDTPAEWVVYCLVDPCHQHVFYVGLTKDIYSRYMQHLRGDGDTNELKNVLLRILKAGHVVPHIYPLRVVSTEQEAKRVEAFYIDGFRTLRQPLLNQQFWISYPRSQEEYEELKIMKESVDHRIPYYLNWLFGSSIELTVYTFGQPGLAYYGVLTPEQQAEKERNKGKNWMEILEEAEEERR